jgi:hypothetical protein
MDKLFETCHAKHDLVVLHKVKKTKNIWGYYMSTPTDNQDNDGNI